MAAPANDNWANAETLTFTDNEYTSALVSNAEATTEAGEPSNSQSSNKSCWWKYTPADDELLWIDTSQSTSTGAGTDTQLAVWTGASLATLTLVGADSDSGGSSTSKLAVSAAAGTTYYIQVGAWNSASMNYRLHVERLNDNDDFADAEPITIATDGGTYTSDPFPNKNATTETGEPSPTGSTSSLSRWWKYTPATTGTATFDTQLTVPGKTSTSKDTIIAVYTGSAVNALTKLASDDDSGGSGTSRIASLAVTAGTTYYLQVNAYQGRDMDYVVRVTGPASSGGGPVPITGTLAVNTPAPAVALAGTAVPPTVTGNLALATPAPALALTGGTASAEVTGTLAVTTPVPTLSLAGTVAGAAITGTLGLATPPPAVVLIGTVSGVDTDLTYSNDGYGYAGIARVVYEPPVEPAAPHRVKVRRVHQSLPPPTLVDGRPT